MNKNESKFNLKTFLTFLTVLVLSLTMVFATACNNNGESTSESTSESQSDSTATETKVDTQTLKNGDFEFTSGKNTTKPNTASSWSIKADGSDYGYATSYSSYVLINTEDSAYEKLASEYKYTVKETVEGQEKDVVKNPRTPFYNEDAEDKGLVDVDDTEVDEKGTQIMMLRNKEYSAQYATSSTTLSVPAGEIGVLSVWVKTCGVESVGGKAGAYLKVKSNVSKTADEVYDPLVIRNINTDGEWVKYSIYLQPNQSKATSYTLILGFGEGNKWNSESHTKGFAYFDAAEFDLVSTDLTGITPDYSIGASDDAAIDLNGADYSTDKEVIVGYSLAENAPAAFDVSGTGAYNEVNPTGSINQNGAISATANEVTIDFSALTGVGSSYTHTTNNQTLAGKSYARISFWAKITAPSYATKATMAIYDVVKDANVASFDNVSTDGYENENTDDFARYTFYVANNFADALTYQLKLSFGPTEKTNVTTNQVLPIGTATFKDFEIEVLTKENYDLADVSTDTRAKKAVLIGDNYRDFVEDEEDEEDTTSDTYSINVVGQAKERLENGEIIPVEDASLNSTLTVFGEASNVTVGVANSKYATSDADINAAFAAVKALNKSSNLEVQALVVKNVTGDNFVSSKRITIPKNSTYVFSINVYAHDAAKAFVRLIDMDKSTSDQKVLMVDGKAKTNIVNADSVAFIGENGFATVTYIITTGNETFDVKVEFGVEGAGVAIFDKINCGTANSTYTSGEVVLDKFYDGSDYVFTTTEKAFNIYYYADEADVGNEDLRLEDEDGNVRFDVGETFIVEALGTVKREGATTDAFIQYYRFDTDDIYRIEAPETEETESVESSSEESVVDDGNTNYGWLQVTSIIIALVLVAVLIAVVVRKSMAGKTSKQKKTENYYHQGYNKNNRYSRKNNVVAPDEEDSAKDYDYGDDDNN